MAAHVLLNGKERAKRDSRGTTKASYVTLQGRLNVSERQRGREEEKREKKKKGEKRMQCSCNVRSFSFLHCHAREMNVMDICKRLRCVCL